MERSPDDEFSASSMMPTPSTKRRRSSLEVVQVSVVESAVVNKKKSICLIKKYELECVRDKAIVDLKQLHIDCLVESTRKAKKRQQVVIDRINDRKEQIKTLKSALVASERVIANANSEIDPDDL